MRAAVCTRCSDADPLSGLSITEVEEPDVPLGWELVKIAAAALNHHDLWTLRGVGVSPDELPIVLGCDGAGTTSDGRSVLIHSVVAGDDGPDETLAEDRRLLSESGLMGTLAESVAVPSRNIVEIPAGMSFTHAACLPTAYLTAYRALFSQARLKPGQTVLVQGAGGGFATAAIVLGRAAGLRVLVTGRDASKLSRAEQIGAHGVSLSGERLSEKVDAVLESVGEATWKHSLRSLRPGGTIVCVGATTGANPPAELNRVFFKQLRIIGSTMGTISELRSLLKFVAAADVEPVIDDIVPLADVPAGMQRMLDGDIFGKIVVSI